ncbi:MAG: phosphoglucosamine mutase [Bacteroidota bacterium]|nr:phosphoglucosamine mutase [Bacteroidota bacterium]
MVLIKSISGIRGTIGGKVGDSLTPLDIVRYTAAYASWIKKVNSDNKVIIVGRDARISGDLVNGIVCNTLISSGLDVINLGLSTTPTVEIAVQMEKSAGGIVITASHNPKNWNALKLLNSEGEFLSEQSGKEVLELADSNCFSFEEVENLGIYKDDYSYNSKHIDRILKLPFVNINAIRRANFKVVLDAVNSTGGIIIPELLEALGVECIKIHCNPNGEFAHNPEPLGKHLMDLSKKVVSEKAHLGIAVDPDVDRLAFVCEDGSMFGEEYTLVAISDLILSKNLGNTVSNLSSTRALKDITLKHGGNYYASAVGEVNVVKKMKETNAVIGGEGNGGVILPDLHYGRDALVGVALFLTSLAEKEIQCTKLKAAFPEYYIVKKKIESNLDINRIFNFLEKKHKDEYITKTDGLKIDFKGKWVHLRKSNTEPIIRIYAEAKNKAEANEMIETIFTDIKKLI